MRDDFSEETKRTCANRVANRCSRPDCRALTSGPQLDPRRALNVGVAAHITAAAPGGPRYDPNLTSEQRRHPDNAIWLCQTSAKLIDNDPARYTASLLRTWKSQAEQEALESLGKTTATFPLLPESLMSLIARVQSRSVPLSVCLVEAIELAKRLGNIEVEAFAMQELIGWYGAPGVPPYPPYRVASVFISLTHQHNPGYLGMGGDPRTILHEMEGAPEQFTRVRLAFPQPVSSLERDYGSDPSKSLLSFTAHVKDFLPSSEMPDAPVFVYGPGNTLQSILEAIREELTRLLVAATKST